MIQATLPGVCIPKGIPNQLHSPYDRDLQERIGPYLVLVVRTVIGVLLGVVLSFIGIGTAWALFLFLGFKLIEVWLAFMFFGEGSALEPPHSLPGCISIVRIMGY